MTAEMLPPDWFLSPGRFAEERDRVFRRSWLYAGTRSELAAGPLTVGTAGLDATVLPDLSARLPGGGRAETALCGEFLFLRAEPGGPDLAAFLGPAAGRLAAMSRQTDQEIGRGAMEFRANWKILVENTMDDFHGSTVHPQTIHPAVHPDWEKHLTTERFGALSRSSWTLSDETAAWWRRVDGRMRLRRFADQPVYDHLFVFPNLYVASFHGAMVIVHTVEPLAEDRSELVWRSHLPILEPAKPGAEAFRRTLAPALMASARAVIEEDRPMCESVQRARVAAGPGRLGRRERRIADFHHCLGERLGLPAPARPLDAPWG